jgi:YbgC/YbaW family acyl-CoA thioester hydrolase
MPSVELKRRIRWADSDPAGRLYYARIFDYFTEAEAELLTQVGISHDSYNDPYVFPRVHAECQFRKVLKLGEAFTIRATIGRLGKTSIRYDFQVFRDDEPEQPAADGNVTVVIMQNGNLIEIPPTLKAALSTD